MLQRRERERERELGSGGGGERMSSAAARAQSVNDGAVNLSLAPRNNKMGGRRCFIEIQLQGKASVQNGEFGCRLQGNYSTLHA